MTRVPWLPRVHHDGMSLIDACPRGPVARQACYVAALAGLLWMVSIMRAHHPLGALMSLFTP